MTIQDSLLTLTRKAARLEHMAGRASNAFTRERLLGQASGLLQAVRFLERANENCPKESPR